MVTARAASFCQEQQVTAHFGKPPCPREQRLYYLQVEGLLHGQGLWAALSIVGWHASCAYASSEV